jgi:hypothetical protein
MVKDAAKGVHRSSVCRNISIFIAGLAITAAPKVLQAISVL